MTPNPTSVDASALTRQYVLDTIASGESSGVPGEGYNELFGGHQVGDLSKFPGVRVAIPGQKGQFTDAAGRYQFLGPTWASQAKKLGLTDFSPASQDAAAWDLANTTYLQQTGRDLQSDAAARNVDWQALGGQWSSLKGAPRAPGSSTLSLPDEGVVAPPTPGPNPAIAKLLLAQLNKSYTTTPVDYDPFAVEKMMEPSGG